MAEKVTSEEVNSKLVEATKEDEDLQDNAVVRCLNTGSFCICALIHQNVSQKSRKRRKAKSRRVMKLAHMPTMRETTMWTISSAE